MRKLKNFTILFFLSLISIIIQSCSDIENITDSEPSISQSSEGLCYIYINISSPDMEISRGDGDNDWSFEDGTESENKINSIRFYFFNAEGDNLKLQRGVTGELLGFYHWTPEAGSVSQDETIGDNIEENVSAMMGIKFEDDIVPAQVLAVVNPTPGIISMASPTLSDLEECLADFKTGLTEDNFVMTNTSYLTQKEGDTDVSADPSDGLKRYQVACTTKISEANICRTQAEAFSNPLKIYVERIAARLDLAYDMDEAHSNALETTGKIFKTALKIKTADRNEEKDIYVEFLGWALTSTPQKSRLLKKIADTWNPDDFFSGSQSWNNSGYHRSFWGVNLPENDMDYKWHSYSAISGEEDNVSGNAYRHTMQDANEYMLENANPFASGNISLSNPLNPTKVIFAARLVDENGEVFDIAQYEGKTYTVDGLKGIIADRLDMYFYDASSGEGIDAYVKIGRDDLDFISALEAGKIENPDDDGNYYVYFRLNPNSLKNKSWYHKIDSTDDIENNKIDDPDAYIASVTFPVKIWSSGRTYYYFAIPHCQDINTDQPGYYGVVRNNIYSVTIKAINTLGTPVYNPDEVIYPRTPEPDDSQLKIVVKTMQWRVERENIQITW